MFLDLLTWALFGLIVGAVVRLLTPGADPMGCLGTIALGVLGSVVGGYLARFFFGTSAEPFQPAGFVGAVLGGLVVMLGLRLIRTSGP